MPPRRDRIAVVVDTNVVVGHLLSPSRRGANSRVMGLWRDERKLQLVVCDELVSEHVGTIDGLLIPQRLARRFVERLRVRGVATWVHLGARPTDSRDPDDNLLLATAKAGKAKYLLTNDRHLLDIPDERKRKFRFEILTPAEFLNRVGG